MRGVRGFARVTARGHGGCTLDIRYISHDVTLAFDTPGAKTIRVHGRRLFFPDGEKVVVPVAIAVE